MSDITSPSTEVPTATEIDGTLLPSTVPTRSELRRARASDLEVQLAATGGDATNHNLPKKQRRPRKPKSPKDSKIYKAVMGYIALKAQGMKGPEIAEQLGLSYGTIRQYLVMANKKGFVNYETFNDPEDRLEVVVADKAVKNMHTVLDEQEEVVIDKETGATAATGRLSDRAVHMTLEVAKGLGMLKQHQVTKTTGETNVGVALRVEVQMPVNPSTGQVTPLQVRKGSIGGTPNFVDAEVIESENES